MPSYNTGDNMSRISNEKLLLAVVILFVPCIILHSAAVAFNDWPCLCDTAADWVIGLSSLGLCTEILAAAFITVYILLIQTTQQKPESSPELFMYFPYVTLALGCVGGVASIAASGVWGSNYFDEDSSNINFFFFAMLFGAVFGIAAGVISFYARKYADQTYPCSSEGQDTELSPAPASARAQTAKSQKKSQDTTSAGDIELK